MVLGSTPSGTWYMGFPWSPYLQWTAVIQELLCYFVTNSPHFYHIGNILQKTTTMSVIPRPCPWCSRPVIWDVHMSHLSVLNNRLGTPRTGPGNYTRASLIAQLVKNPPAMQETPFRFLGREDPLKGKAPHSGILAWRIPWTV